MCLGEAIYWGLMVLTKGNTPCETIGERSEGIHIARTVLESVIWELSPKVSDDLQSIGHSGWGRSLGWITGFPKRSQIGKVRVSTVDADDIFTSFLSLV